MTGVTCAAVALSVLIATTMVLPTQQAGAPREAAHAESAAAPPPRLADGRPDFSGVWWAGPHVAAGRSGLLAESINPSDQATTAPMPARAPSDTFAALYQPWAVAKAKTLGDADDPSRRCIPVAFGTLNVSLFNMGFVGQIVHQPGVLVMLTETYHTFKIIPTDGRAHREDVPPSYRGDSVGHWEGDTLVVEHRNFSDTNWMHAEGIVSFHSAALRIVERYRRPDAATMVVDTVVEDQEVLTRPWVVPTQTLRLAPFDQIMEIGCSSAERHR